MRLDDAVRLLETAETVTQQPAPPKKQSRRRALRPIAAVLSAVVLVAVIALTPLSNVLEGAGGQSSTTGATTTTSSSSSAATTSAPATPQVIGNVFTSNNMRIEAQSGWSISVNPGANPEANLSKYGEGYMRVVRLNDHSSLESLVQQRRSLVDLEQSSVSQKGSMALWTYKEPSFCGSFAARCTILVWSTVVGVSGGFVAITYNKRVEVPDAEKDASDDIRAQAAIEAAVNWITLS